MHAAGFKEGSSRTLFMARASQPEAGPPARRWQRSAARTGLIGGVSARLLSVAEDGGEQQVLDERCPDGSLPDLPFLLFVAQRRIKAAD